MVKAATARVLLALLVAFAAMLGVASSWQAQAQVLPVPRERVVIPFHGDPRVRSERPEGPIPRNLRIKIRTAHSFTRSE
jgi:hypothetical protein